MTRPLTESIVPICEGEHAGKSQKEDAEDRVQDAYLLYLTITGSWDFNDRVEEINEGVHHYEPYC